MNGEAILVEDTTWGRVQGAVAAYSFYAYETGRSDPVVITKKFRETLMNDTLHKIDCYFSKFLRFVKIDSTKVSKNHFPRDAENCGQCNHNPTHDLCIGKNGLKL